MVALVLLIGGIALGIASLLDLTPDTRDPAFGLGPFFSHRFKGNGSALSSEE